RAATRKPSCEKLLGAFHATGDMHAVRAIYRARSAIGAADGRQMGELEITLAAQRELAVAFGIGKAAQYVGNWQSFTACALAHAAHAAIERANPLQMRGENAGVGG